MLANGSHSAPKTSDKQGGVQGNAANEPSPFEKLNWLIHLYHIRGQIASCKLLIQNEIEKSRGMHEFAYYKKGIILREEGKLQEALETFQICHRLNPDNVDNFKEIGKCLYLLKRYRLALEAYLEAEKITSKADWEIYHCIAECYLHLKDLQKAHDYIQLAVQMGKQETSYSLMIKILALNNDFKAAVVVCNNAVESCPDSINMLTQSGILYLKIGETQHAFERLSSALALDGNNPKALLGIGCITQSYEEYDVALSKYKIAVQSDADSVALWNNIGMCFYAKQKYIAAATCLKRALWLSPLNWRILLNLGLVNLATNQPASAFNFLCAAVNIRPDMGAQFMILGCALLELHDGENAIRALAQALTLNPDDPTIVINSCLCFYLNGHQEAAVQLLDKYQAVAANLKNEQTNALFAKLEAIMAYGNTPPTIENTPSENAESQDAAAAAAGNHQYEHEEDEV